MAVSNACILLVQAAGGRRMTGHEAVSCTVTAPDGKVHAVPVTLADGSGHFQATLHWLQVGVHKVRPLSPPPVCRIPCEGCDLVWSKNVGAGPIMHLAITCGSLLI